MRHIIIASHHRLAEGLADTLRFVGGDMPIGVVCAYMDDTPVEEQVDAAFAGVDSADEVLVFTDMMQGSVNQAFLQRKDEHVFIVTGINLPCALELALYTGSLTAAYVHEVIDRARQELLFVNDCVVSVDEDDE